LGGRMFYSGAAFHMHYSGYLWRYNEDVVIPKMVGRNVEGKEKGGYY